MKQKTSSPVPKQSAASRYKAARILTVKLPSNGEEIQIRKIDMTDFIALGGIPDAFLTAEAYKAAKAGDSKKLEKIGEGHEDYAERFTRAVCTRCVIDPGFRVVDKPAHECGEDEIPYCVLSFVDRQAIQAAVCGESGLSKEVAESAKPFPEKQAAPVAT